MRQFVDADEMVRALHVFSASTLEFFHLYRTSSGYLLFSPRLRLSHESPKEQGCPISRQKEEIGLAANVIEEPACRPALRWRLMGQPVRYCVGREAGSIRGTRVLERLSVLKRVHG